MSSIETTIFKLALENALKFKGKANPKALIGHVIKEHPEVKKDMKSTMQTINKIVDDVNALDTDTQKQKLFELDPEFNKKKQEEKQQRREQRRELPELNNAIQGAVTTRIPPEPSKYNHLGHAMSFLLNYLYGKKYEGKVILRFDDTNPEKSAQEYVDAVFEDVVDFLQLQPDEIVFASHHMDKYISFAQQLIEEGKAYVCSCDRPTISQLRKEKKACSHRDQSIEETKQLWNEMKNGSCKEGSRALRLKIDMTHKNAVMRDPVIYRVSYKPHYKKGTRYPVWPMYDFECAIEEGLCGVTHVLRSNEFDQRIELQNHIARLFGFPEVTYTHYGRYNITGATTQGREIRSLIETGKFLGWHDPRLVTIRALRKRGIIRESFIELAKQIGLSKTQTNLDFGVIASINRQLLDKKAERYFCIRNPVTITVSNIPSSITSFSLKKHPSDDSKHRELKATREYSIEREDFERISNGSIVRFMDSMNVRRVENNKFEFVSQDVESYKESENTAGLIHFIPCSGKEIRAKLVLENAQTTTITCESSIENIAVGEIIQFERFAFCRLDHIEEDGTKVFWFGHE
ncbi:MAG: glutamate--tRNA ligase [Nanobdellota archaeon]